MSGLLMMRDVLLLSWESASKGEPAIAGLSHWISSPSRPGLDSLVVEAGRRARSSLTIVGAVGRAIDGGRSAAALLKRPQHNPTLA
jgi:hypothetical protein